MKNVISVIALSMAALHFSCSNEPAPAITPSSGEKGTVQLTLHLGKAGALGKEMKNRDVEMASLIIVLSADGQGIVYDTLALTGGSGERTERKTYSGLVACSNDASIEWTLSAGARDQNGRTTHSGDTAFVIPCGDTMEIQLYLNALYSMLVANYYPIRDSVTRCVLAVDGSVMADSSFPEQSLVGKMATLSCDYVAASPSGTTHHIEMNVYGDIGGSEALLYRGETAIKVRSGEGADYPVVLAYVGPDYGKEAMSMGVMLGSADTVSINGQLPGTDRYFLTMTSGGNGTVSVSDSVTPGIPHTIAATAAAGYRFAVWRVTGGTAVIADSAAASTSVTLENGDAAIQGIFSIETSGITFQKNYGGVENDFCYCVQQTSDGGYIICGESLSSNTGNENPRYTFLVKIDAFGDTTWTRKLGGGTNYYNSNSIQQTSDNGFIIGGTSYSLIGTSYNPNVELIKTDADGNMVWTKIFGGADGDFCNSVRQTADNGFIIAGYTLSFGAGSRDVYLVKTDADGDTVWTRTFGGANGDEAYSVQQTNDGGYIISGYTFSFGTGNEDVYLIKTDAGGDTVWTRRFGGPNVDYGYSVQQTNDGGYVIAGATSSSGAGGDDVYLIKTGSDGNMVWTRTFGAANADYGFSVQQTVDGGYVIAGSTNSFGEGDDDFYLVKTDAEGDTVWTRRFGGAAPDYGRSVRQTSDGGYVVAGSTYVLYGNTREDFYLVKTDREGKIE